MNLVLSKNFKEAAILIHSNLSIDYYYNNGTHNLDSLLPNIRNLKSLTFYNNTSRKINLKSILLPELQEVYLNVGYWSYLPDFLRNNGRNFKGLSLYGCMNL